MYLDMPLKMSGQPSIFKMPKELMYGARPLLKKAPYKWWPLKQFENFVAGQFDIYPDEYNSKALKTLLNSESVRAQPVVDKLQALGCYAVTQSLTA